MTLFVAAVLATGLPALESVARAAPVAKARPYYRPRADAGPPFPELPAGFVPVRPFVPFKRVFAYDPPKATILFLARSRPVRIELAADDGPSSADRWTTLLKALFAAADRDGDGYLNRHEAEHVFSLAEVRQLLASGAAVRTAAAGPLPDIQALDRDGDGRASFDEFAAYYDPLAAGLLSVAPQVTGPAATDFITAELFARLDLDRDGRITAEEFRKADALLAKLDADEDECLTVQEFLADRLTRPADDPPPARGMRPTAPPSPDLTAVLGPLPGNIVQQMLKKYDTDGDFALTRTEIGFTREDFDRLDTNRDGKLSAAELDAWRTMPADLVVRGKAVTKDSPAPFAVAKGGGFPGGLVLPDPAAGSLAFRIGTQTLDLGGADGRGTGDRSVSPWEEVLRANPGGVRESDLAGPQYQYLRVVFDCVDRDGDGRVTRDEAAGYLRLQRDVAAAGRGVAFAARVPNLFGLIDADGDGRLSARELRTAHARLAPLDPTGDGAVTRAVLQPVAFVRVGPRAAVPYDRAFTGPVAVARTPPAAGPLWFRKMDRNGDGELSRSEFLGTAADFDALDADRDGYVSAAEAEAFDKAHRKAK